MPVAELPDGTVLKPTHAGGGRFRIEKKLGGGGFGLTYLARDAEFDDLCVIKEFAQPELCGRETMTGTIRALAGREVEHRSWVEKFISEARTINRIRHKNVVQVRSVWPERGTAYYAMDYVANARELVGSSSDQWRPWPWAQVLPVAEQLLDALEAIHEKDLIHGDIKPPNVLLDGRDHVTVIDFGTARTTLELKKTVTAATYTPGYAPIELMARRAVKQAGPWSDLYSWGMVVYGMLLPHPGLDHEPVLATTRQVVSQSGGADLYAQARSLLEGAGVPAPWAALVAACIELDPDARPRSVADARARLRAPIDTNRTVIESTGGHRAFPGPHFAPPAPPEPPSPPVVPTPERVTGGTRLRGNLADTANVSSVDTAAPARGQRTRVVIAALALVAAAAAGYGAWKEGVTIDRLTSLFQGGGAADAGVADEPDAAPHTAPEGELVVASMMPGAQIEVDGEVVGSASGAEDVTVTVPTGDQRVRVLLGDAVLFDELVAIDETGSKRVDAVGSPSAWTVIAPGRLEIVEGARDAGPYTVATDTPLLVGRYEVTQQQWHDVMETSPSFFGECGGSCPVERVSYYDAVSFANELSASEGLPRCYELAQCDGATGSGCDPDAATCDGSWQCETVERVAGCTGYRLPSALEWEYVARGGHDAETWLGAVEVDGLYTAPVLDGIAVHGGNSVVSSYEGAQCPASPTSDDRCGPSVAGSREVNPMEVHDVLGNVWEWVDGLGEEGTGEIRGGSWGSSAGAVWAGSGQAVPAALRSNQLGFRLVRTLGTR